MRLMYLLIGVHKISFETVAYVFDDLYLNL